MHSVQLDSNRLGQLKEEMTAVYSNLLNALKEIVAEQEYLSGIWMGDAAEAFCSAQKNCLMKLEECADKTEALLMLPASAEDEFRQCEKKVSKLIGEWSIWDI